MSGRHKQGEGGVASIVTGLVNSFLGRPETQNHEDVDPGDEAVELESPLNVLNQAALRNGPETSTPNKKSKNWRSGLAQGGIQTRAATAAATSPPERIGRTRSGTNEKSSNDAPLPTRTSPRGHKRSREANDDILVASKSPRTRRSADLGQNSTAVSKDKLGGKSQSIVVEVPRATAGQLRRPSTISRTTRSRPKQHGEEVFEVGPSPEKRRTIPPVAASPQKGQRKTKQKKNKANAPEKRPVAEESLAESGEGNDATAKRLRQPRKPITENEPKTSMDDLHETTEYLVEEDEPNPAFLGVQSTWDEIRRLARENRMNGDKDGNEDRDQDGDDADDHDDGDDSSDRHGQCLAEHLTKSVEELSQIIQKVKRQYKVLRNGKSDEEAEQEINEDISESIEEIEATVTATREFDVDDDNKKIARRKGREMITDIYRRGVPDLIDLLDEAIVCRSSVPPEIYDFNTIQEIVQLIDVSIHLCDTAAKWKAKPLPTYKPIVRNVRSIVLPGLRGKIKTVFDREMQRLLVMERKQRNHAKTQTQDRQLQEEAEEIAELEARRRAEELWRIEDDIRLTQELFRNRRFGLWSLNDSKEIAVPQSRHAQYQVENDDSSWTLDQERELLKQLQKANSRNLPATERYLKILNASPLQNKLPDHIKKKALELKPLLLEILPDANYIHSIE